MSTADLAYVTPTVVEWARKRAGLTQDAAATLIDNCTPDLIHSWESGRVHPTLTQAREFASKIQVPFAVLFMPEPPTIEVQIPDLRTVASIPVAKLSPDLMDVVTQSLIRRRWLHEYLENARAHPLVFVGKYTLGDNNEAVANEIRSLLGINDSFRQQCRDYRQFLSALIRRVEHIGILVMRGSSVDQAGHRKLDAKEFRGFAISDSLAPVVFINSRDAQAAQIFTLAHELVHIWIGATGVSNLNLAERPESITNKIEAFCNQTAAELLVPKSEFLGIWNKSKTHDQNVGRISAHFKVSRSVVIRRAYELDKLSLTEFYRLSKIEYEKLLAFRKSNEARKRKVNFWNVFYARNGHKFTETVLRSVMANRTSYIDAARLLGTKATVIATLLPSIARG